MSRIYSNASEIVAVLKSFTERFKWDHVTTYYLWWGFFVIGIDAQSEFGTERNIF